MNLQDVKQANPKWFSKENKRFFQDVNYRLLHSKVNGQPYLVRSTYQWSDMFGRPKKLVWRINPISETNDIEPLVDEVFDNLWAVKRWLKAN